MNTSHKIIGLAGAFASGKDSLARFLEINYQIKHISTSDMVRLLAQEKYGSIERPILYKTANEFRESHGAGALSRMALEQYEAEYRSEYPGGVCVSGFRAWAEAEVIKDAGGTIIFTDAPAEIRYQRAVHRARDNEKLISFEEFMQRERDENGGVNREFSIIALKDRADIVVDNTKSLDDFIAEACERLGLRSFA